MDRFMSYRTADDGVLLLEEQTVAFRLTSRYERPPAELGVAAGREIRVEIRDDRGHLLDALTYVAPSTATALST